MRVTTRTKVEACVCVCVCLLDRALRKLLLRDDEQYNASWYQRFLWKLAGEEDINLETRKRKFRWIGHT